MLPHGLSLITTFSIEGGKTRRCETRRDETSVPYSHNTPRFAVACIIACTIGRYCMLIVPRISNIPPISTTRGRFRFETLRCLPYSLQPPSGRRPPHHLPRRSDQAKPFCWRVSFWLDMRRSGHTHGHYVRYSFALRKWIFRKIKRMLIRNKEKHARGKGSPSMMTYPLGNGQVSPCHWL